MNKVYIAFYCDGFYDNPPEILAVCATPFIAGLVIENHKATRDCSMEYKDKAEWRIESWDVLDGLSINAG